MNSALERAAIAAVRRLRKPPGLTPSPTGMFAELDQPRAMLEVGHLPDGPIVKMDSGQVVANFGGAPGEVRAGEWVHNVDGFQGRAAYAEADLGADVTRIGVRARFDAGSPAGALALVLPSATWAGDRHDRAAGVHFVVTGDGHWNIGRYANKRIRPVYAAGRVADLRGAGDVAFEIAVNRAESAIHLSLPGDIQGAARADYLEETSRFAVFELFESGPTERSARLVSMWAD